MIWKDFVFFVFLRGLGFVLGCVCCCFGGFIVGEWFEECFVVCGGDFFFNLVIVICYYFVGRFFVRFVWVVERLWDGSREYSLGYKIWFICKVDIFFGKYIFYNYVFKVRINDWILKKCG